MLIVFFFTTSSFYAQGIDEFSSDKEEAYYHIKALKNGSLVVRLKSQDRKIMAYRASGNEKFADKLERELAAFNKDLVNAFINHFKFCDVFFIEPNDYGLVRNQIPSGYFLDENLEVDSSITMSFKGEYFFCEYSPVYAEALEDNNEARRKIVTATPKLQEALVIKDEHLTQLLSPFPNHVSIRLKEMDKVVEKLNNRLYNYHLSVTQ
jgi:hypothetical protein